jgi:hypothetical protein
MCRSWDPKKGAITIQCGEEEDRVAVVGHHGVTRSSFGAVLGLSSYSRGNLRKASSGLVV